MRGWCYLLLCVAAHPETRASSDSRSLCEQVFTASEVQLSTWRDGIGRFEGYQVGTFDLEPGPLSTLASALTHFIHHSLFIAPIRARCEAIACTSAKEVERCVS